jgi:hypothetical protein
MTRKELVMMREEIFAKIRECGQAILYGTIVDPRLPQQLTFLVMLHGSVCAQLKAWEEAAAHANAVCQLDEVLGLLTDVRLGSKQPGDVLDELRLKIHSVLAYLES